MTKYAVELSKRALTPDQSAMAQQYITGAQEAGCKVTRENVRSVFPPGVSDLVVRYLRGV